MSEYYNINNDYPMMSTIDHFVKLSNKDDYKYKFIEIVKRIENSDCVFLQDLKLLEKEFKCPIIKALIKGSGYYLNEEISSEKELNRYLGNRYGKYKSKKLDFEMFRKALCGLW